MYQKKVLADFEKEKRDILINTNRTSKKLRNTSKNNKSKLRCKRIDNENNEIHLQLRLR